MEKDPLLRARGEWVSHHHNGEKKDYNGGRELDELQSFTAETLDKTRCEVNTLADYSKKEISYIEKMNELTPEECKEKLEAVQKLKGNKFVKDPNFVGHGVAIPGGSPGPGPLRRLPPPPSLGSS